MSARNKSSNPFLFESGLKSSCSNPCVGLKQLNFFCENNPCNYGKSRYDLEGLKCECELNGGAIGGVVAGVLAGVILISLIVFYFIWRRHRANNLTTNQVCDASTVVHTNGAPPPPLSLNTNQPLLPTFPQPPQVYSQSPCQQQPQYHQPQPTLPS